MFGMRTPAKRPSNDTKTPPIKPEEKSVRLSIGEWEAASSTTMPILTQAGPAKKSTQTLKQESKNKASDKTFVRTPTSPKRTWPTGRVSEARACLNKGKLNLENWRNLKTEIKLGVTEALDRLYALVKEAEAERKARSGPETKESKETSHRETQTAEAQPSTQDHNDVTVILEEHTRMLLENNKRLMEIQSQIESQKEHMERMSTQTYASVTAPRPGRGTLHSVVVTSKDETETGEEMLSRIRQAVDAKEGWVKVEKVRKARDRKVIIGFNTKEEREKVKRRLGRDSVNLTVEDMKNKDPLLVLRGVLAVNTDMFGFRTPAKRPPTESRTPPSSAGEKSVRLSIGEWEAAGTSAASTKTRAGSIKQPQLTQPQRQEQKSKASDKTYIKTPTSPKRWPAGRASEARGFLNKGKLHLENSRNLKTEIKQGVTEALERLYALVKDAEAELKKGRTAPELKEPSEVAPNVTQADAQPTPDLEQKNLVETLEEHSRLLLENNKKLQDIQTKIENQRELLERVTTDTYASVVAIKLPCQSTLHSVVVTSKARPRPVKKS